MTTFKKRGSQYWRH